MQQRMPGVFVGEIRPLLLDVPCLSLRVHKALQDLARPPLDIVHWNMPQLALQHTVNG